MKQYLELIQHVLDTGEWTENRTGIRTIMVPGAMMTFDHRKGFPAVTTKKLAFKSVVGELCAFLRASRSAADFRALGCKVWDANANENKDWLANPYRIGEDDLGPVYGVQWRKWPSFKLLNWPEKDALIEEAKFNGWQILDEVGSGGTGLNGRLQVVMYKEIDQLRTCLDTIVNNPDSRRILFHGWNPAVLDEVALPACHILYQFMPNRKNGLIHMNVYLRSNDLGLGAPFNIAESSVLQSLVGRLTGYKPGLLNVFIGDAHIYENHIDMVTEQLKREVYDAPELKINERVAEFHRDGYQPQWLELVEPSDFTLEGYKHHEPLTAPMAV
jgi:thymidylate synthase